MPETTPGYIPPRLLEAQAVSKFREKSLSRLVEQVICYLDKPVTVDEVFVEAVKYVPYATRKNIAGAVENMATPDRHANGSHVERVGQVPNPEYGKRPRAPRMVSTFVVEPPMAIDESEIVRLPDWRPTEYVPRGKKKPGRKTTLADQQRQAKDRERKRLEREAKKEEADSRFNVLDAPAVVGNGQYPLFRALYRDFTDPELVIIRDEQGNLWEARRREDQSLGS